MTNNKTSPVVGTSRGKPITDADIERMADGTEASYEITTLRPCGSRPAMGSGPADVVPVRLDPELRAGVEELPRPSTSSVLKSAAIPSSSTASPCRHSVAFGCPTLASVIHTVRRSSSMQYQIRPPAVTSYCHCSISLPLTARVPSELFRRCCRVSTRRGSAVRRSHATRAFADAAEQICSQPDAASLVANRKSQPSLVGGGATRSLRFGTRDQLGTGTASPSASMGRRRRRASRRSA